MSESADVLVVGSGISGLLVARELLAAGREVTIVERGPLRLDADKLPLEEREAALPTTAHNTEAPPGEHIHGWQYGYAYGGSSLLWAGVAPRLLPSDFELHTRHGVGRDWPISYDDLIPFYQEAERALRVCGRPDPAFPGTDAYLEPPRPSDADLLVGPLLEPFGTLPIARELAAPGQYPPPLEGDASAVERSVTILGVAREVADSPGLRVVDRSAAARLRTAAGQVEAVECVGADGDKFELRANQVVLATHGIENPALLLRSGLDGPAVGRWLGDHTHVILDVELAEPHRHWDA
ncbi:MAG TPA: GMC family oxidoreductase, partial [Solirubrobacterales bacterium]|nr:GMC family oxidoreductase [Solirubrobacterales bacterium]